MRYLNIPIVSALRLFQRARICTSLFQRLAGFFRLCCDWVLVAAGHSVLPVKVGDCTGQSLTESSNPSVKVGAWQASAPRTKTRRWQTIPPTTKARLLLE